MEKYQVKFFTSILFIALITFVGQNDIIGRTEVREFSKSRRSKLIDINSIYLIELEKPEDTTVNLIKDQSEFLRGERNLSIDFR